MLVSPKMAADQGAKLECTYCTEDIVGVGIRCFECKDIDLCLQCFAGGAEIGNHKNNHSYTFVDSGASNESRGKRKLSPLEHAELLGRIEKYGFGNYDNKGYGRRTSASEDHIEYIEKFVDGTLGQALWPEAYAKRARLHDFLKDEEWPISLAPIRLAPEDALLLGYMPNRDDFDQEYDNNEAESLLASPHLLKIPDDNEDDDLDISLKLAQVDMYFDRLKERARRRRIAKDYQLIDKYFMQSRRLKTTKTPEQDFEDKFRWMCQFQTAQEHQCLIKNLLRQRQLEFRLAELIKYRNNGLTKIEELPHFEQEIQASRGSSGSSSLHFPTATVSKKKERNEEREIYSTGRSSMYHTGNHGLLQELAQRLQLDSHPRLAEPSKHLLNKTEVQLCSNLKITPSQFISVKTLLLANPHEIAESNPEKQIQKYIHDSGWFLAA